MTKTKIVTWKAGLTVVGENDKGFFYADPSVLDRSQLDKAAHDLKAGYYSGTAWEGKPSGEDSCDALDWHAYVKVKCDGKKVNFFDLKKTSGSQS